MVILSNRPLLLGDLQFGAHIAPLFEDILCEGGRAHFVTL